MKKLNWTVWRPRLAYGAFTLLAFVLALRWTFPAEAVKERLILEAGARGWQIDMDQVRAGGLVGVHAESVRLDDQAGLKVELDRVDASLRLLPLLRGRPVLAWDADLWDGRITGSADLAGAERHATLRIDGLDLARALPLKKATGVDLQGKVGGTADLVLPQAPDGKPTGRIDLAIADAGVAGGQVPIPGMTGGLPLPKVALGAITAAVKLDQGKAMVEKLEARGGEAELTGEGLSVVLQPRLEFAPLFGKAKVKLQPSFWQKSQTQAFKSLAEMALASSRGPDGAYQFQVFGSLGHPALRPAGGGGVGSGPQ